MRMSVKHDRSGRHVGENHPQLAEGIGENRYGFGYEPL
jgi:hypothetical protein